LTQLHRVVSKKTMIFIHSHQNRKEQTAGEPQDTVYSKTSSSLCLETKQVIMQ
jgi:hypothetical protein